VTQSSLPAAFVYTVDPEHDALRLIARAALAGQLGSRVFSVPLAAWTIYLPTRRAARRLGEVLLQESGKNSLVLPRIQPIGDLDSDADDMGLRETAGIAKALSETELLFETLRHVNKWVEENSGTPLAEDVSASRQHGIKLAQSLVALVNQAETEEVSLAAVADVYDFLETAAHREQILSLLTGLERHLAEIARTQNLIGPSAQRNFRIRRGAALIPHDRPVIVVGSTGTNPATRALLGAVARAAMGAVVLPGLDLGMENDDWASIKETHPQYGLSRLLHSMDLTRADVVRLGDEGPRQDLMREIMRPSERTHLWFERLARSGQGLRRAARGVHLVEAGDTHLEARAIALIMRKAMTGKRETVALVTPDRSLAQRVKAELSRWSITIDDSAGEPLRRHGIASLADCLLRLIETDFDAEGLAALLHHPLMQCGLEPYSYHAAARAIDITVLRQAALSPGVAGLRSGLELALLERETRTQRHPSVLALPDTMWPAMQHIVDTLLRALQPLSDAPQQSIALHVAALQKTLEALYGNRPQFAQDEIELEAIFAELTRGSERLGDVSLRDAAFIMSTLLAQKSIRLPDRSRGQLAIYGLPEARLMTADIVILAGLNEGLWPRQPQAGPWLNRPMREAFGLQLPERDIGLTAHDFAEAMGKRRVFLTWSKRAGTEPLVPSRWILRLQTVLRPSLAEKEVRLEDKIGQRLLALAAAMDKPAGFKPVGIPRPDPVPERRPRAFSVTEIERFNRDPYEIYAKKVLGLKPLDPLGRVPDERIRGILFHAALEQWTKRAPSAGAPASVEILIEEGQAVFERYGADPKVRAFWWPRFLRIARWIHREDEALRQNLVASAAEHKGVHHFDVEGISYSLSGRADRIDISGKTARIIDYKSGVVPSSKQVETGFAPQLTLMAAMLMRGAFGDGLARQTDEGVYIRITGRNPPGETVFVGADGTPQFDFAVISNRHYEGLRAKLALYAKQGAFYLPRVAQFKTTDVSDYDHLSRYLEWNLRTSDPLDDTPKPRAAP
jgi:ATP-dependent helicase/nuclease subunit B